MDESPSFLEALRETHGIEPSLRWESYRTSTDTGIVREILEGHLGRGATRAEVASVCRRFVARCRFHLQAGTARVQVAGGARDFLLRLAEAAAPMAAATGNVEEGARLKLRHAGLDDVLQTGAYSDTFEERKDILLQAKALAERRAETSFAPGEVVYFGDQPWDFRAARACGFRFVGIATTDARRARLRSVGDCPAFPDFRDARAILDALA